LKMKVLFDKLDHETAVALVNPTLQQLITLIEKKLGMRDIHFSSVTSDDKAQIKTMEKLIETLEAKLAKEREHSEVYLRQLEDQMGGLNHTIARLQEDNQYLARQMG